MAMSQIFSALPLILRLAGISEESSLVPSPREQQALWHGEGHGDLWVSMGHPTTAGWFIMGNPIV